MDRSTLGNTIATAIVHMTDQLQIYGDDRSLLPDDDPYSTPVIEGVDCKMRIVSQRTPGTQSIPHHLTYRIVLNALQGLFQFLYTEDHAVSAVSEVLDPGLTGSMVRVGVVSIRPVE